ncbi:MAG: hypothetical protein IJK77_08250 [Lachnospiraceae bacterium]|nr:hypothetical protein [Lachnospiraceae bacterium]
MNKELNSLSVRQLTELYRKKEVSPVEVTTALFEAIDQRKDLNAWATLSPELALQQAKEAEKRLLSGQPKSLMDGIPYGVKDIIYTKGIRTTMCSRVCENFVPEYNAGVIDALEDAGAVLLGKLNTQEFATSAYCDASIFGPVHNPLNDTKIPGGSSGGNGAALAAHLCPASVGADCAGSIRIPSAICGTVGMRPTFGRVSNFGAYAHSENTDCIGPMTRTVYDNAIMMGTMAVYDKRDPFSANRPSEDFTMGIEEPLKGVRIGVLREVYYDTADTRVRDAVEDSVALLKELGAEIQELKHPDPDGQYAAAAHTVRICDMYSNSRRYINESPELFFPATLEHMKTGEGYKAWQYIDAQKLRAEFRKKMTEEMAKLDALVMPTMPIIAPNRGQREMSVNGKVQPLSILFSLYTIYGTGLGFPCLSMPCGAAEGNLSISVQLMGKAFDEAKVYRAGYHLEQALKGKEKIYR